MKSRVLFAPAILVVIALGSFGILSQTQNQERQEKQFALLMKSTGPDFFRKVAEPEGQRLVGEHVQRLQALTNQGVIIFSGHSLNHDDTGFGIIVVRAESEAAARKIIDEDQLVKAGLVRGTVFPFQVVTSENESER